MHPCLKVGKRTSACKNKWSRRRLQTIEGAAPRCLEMMSSMLATKKRQSESFRRRWRKSSSKTRKMSEPWSNGKRKITRPG
jgi:hypothetical protein